MDFGYLSRSSQDLITSRYIWQINAYFNRLDYVSVLPQEIWFIVLVEYLLNIWINFLCEYFRFFLIELARILNHILCLTSQALDSGLLTLFLWGFEHRELILNIFELFSGARLHVNFLKFTNINLTFYIKLNFFFFINFLLFLKTFDEFYYILIYNKIWLLRLWGSGFLVVNLLLFSSVSGVLLRSSGICYDLRKLTFFWQYYFIFVILSVLSENFSRFLLRFLEIYQALIFIVFLLFFLFLNNYENYILNFFLFEFLHFYLNIENLIFLFKINVIFYIWSSLYFNIESPRGEFGCFFVIKKNLYFFKKCYFRTPSFYNIFLLFFFLGVSLIDFIITLGSIDVVLGEIDR